MSKICEESRVGKMPTTFEKVKIFINQKNVDCNDCSVSNILLDNISVPQKNIKRIINAEMSEELQKIGFKTPFMRVQRWEFEPLFDDRNFEIIGYFDDATETTVYIRGFMSGYENTDCTVDEECRALVEALG